MKKRGQLPNARTFTVMFRGLAQSQHPKQAVAEAVKHYNVLLNDKRLEPNSIHLNAVLNVCARAGDMDNMFLIANSVNESTRSPTAFTYTTIFNALRHSGIPRELSTSRSGGRERGKEVGDDKLSDEQRYNIAVQTLDRAKGLWEEVVRKWSAGRLVIDEELVCSMGRLLLASPRRADKRQIFDLLEQTMKMPNLVARPELGTSDPDESMRNISAMSEEGDKSQDKRPDVAAVSASRSSSPPKKRSGGAPATHAIPGRNTLALVLSTLSATRDTTAGIKYWNLMVRHYGVLPDRDNWLRLLGMLKVARAGAHAASIVDLMPDEYLRASKEKGATDDSYKPFRIAMEACVRDNLNRNTVANANRVLDSMLRRLERPDLHTLRLYLRVCLVSHAHLRSMPDAEAAKRLYGTQITEALGRLWDPYKAAHYRAFKAGTSSARADGTAPRAVAIYNAQREVIALARHIISAFDKVVNEHLLPDQDLRDLKPITAKINREVQAFYADRESREPSLPSAVKRAKQQQQQQTSTPAQEDTRNPEDVEADISLRQGSEWVWDTYRPPRTDADTAPRPYSSRNGRNGERREKRGGNKMMYPWESDSTNARSQPRPRHQSRPGTRYGRSNDRPGSRRQ